LDAHVYSQNNNGVLAFSINYPVKTSCRTIGKAVLTSMLVRRRFPFGARYTLFYCLAPFGSYTHFSVVLYDGMSLVVDKKSPDRAITVFLLVLCRHLPFICNCSEVTKRLFSIVENGQLSISACRGVGERKLRHPLVP
jgi:hypothetical protein